MAERVWKARRAPVAVLRLIAWEELNDVERQRLYRGHLRSAYWRRLRDRARERAGGCCERCGDRGTARYGGGVLHVHHRHYDSFGWEQLEDVEVICEGCHRREHGLEAAA